MKSLATKRFWSLFLALPVEVQQLATKTYSLWRLNPGHPSIRFRRLRDSELFTARVGDHYRALGRLQGDTIIWLWIGSHAGYDRIKKE